MEISTVYDRLNKRLQRVVDEGAKVARSTGALSLHYEDYDDIREKLQLAAMRAGRDFDGRVETNGVVVRRVRMD